MHKSNAILAVLLAACAIGAHAQTTGAAQGKPATGETYRPSLDGQQTSTPAPTVDMRPMTEAEKATGRQEPTRLKDIDPSTHPAPQNVRPQPAVTPPRQDGKAVQPTARRPVQQQIDSTGRLAAPQAPGRVLDAPTAAAPAPAGPSANPIQACTGATCIDASGASTAGQVGNAAVNSAGRLCNRTGNTMQCF